MTWRYFIVINVVHICFPILGQIILIFVVYARYKCTKKLFRSEVRMRRHASKQNSVPNNLRPIPPPIAGTSTTAAAMAKTNNDNRLSQQSTSSIGDGPSTTIGPATTSGGVTGHQQQKGTRTVKDQRDVKAKRNEWRITKMVLAIFFSFVMCYLPITIAKIADKDVKLPALHILGYMMLYLSACINPIIYVIMNKQYRQAYKTVLLCKPVRMLAFTNGGSSIGGK